MRARRRYLLALTFATVSAAMPWRVATQPGVPTAPTNLQATVAGTTVTLIWESDAGATSFQIEAALAAGGPAITSLPVAGSPLIVTDVPAGSYWVRVRGVNTIGAGPTSTEVLVTVGAVPCGLPNPPTGLTHSVSAGLVSFSWSAAVGGCTPTHYTLVAGSGPGLSNLASMNVGLGASLQVNAPPGSYYVRVLATNGSGSSAPSNEATVVVGPACSAPGAPQNFLASATSTTAAFQWQPPLTGDPPTSYLLEAGSSPTTADLASLPVQGLSFSTPAPPGSYYLRVRGVNACGPGPASATQFLTIVCVPPGAPGTPGTSVSGTTATLSWHAVAGALQYQVEVGTAAGASNVAVRLVTATSTQFTGLSAGMYFTRLRAMNACGPGATSGEAIFTIAQSPGSRTCGGAAVPGSAQCGVPTARCNDGTWSCSQNRSGTCSSHRGVSCWVCPGPLC